MDLNFLLINFLPTIINMKKKLNKLWLWSPLGIICLVLNYAYKYYIYGKYKILLYGNFNTYVLKDYIFNLLKGIFFGFIEKIRLKGRGYKIYFKSQKLYLKLGYSHGFYRKIPPSLKIIVSGRKKKLLIFLSILKNTIRMFSTKLFFFYSPEIYVDKGFLKFNIKKKKKKETKVPK
jgi:hypothetical protein